MSLKMPFGPGKIMRSVGWKMHFLASCLIATLACSNQFTYSQTRSDRQQTYPASIHSKWDSVFEFKTGWTGGDGAGTVDLGEGRILWMFGDSFIGKIADGKHAAGSHMVNNVIAIQKIRDRNAPRPEDFQFAWGPDNANNKPTAWLAPDSTRVKPSATIKNKKHPHGWYWPAGGGMLVKSKTGPDQLVVFLFHVGSTGEQGVWSFKNIGGAMAVVDNPNKPLKQWKVRQLDLPHTIDRDQIDKDRSLKETNWGMACLSVDSNQGHEQPYIYVYGTRQQTRWNRHLIVARVRGSEIEQFSKWEFFAGKQQGADATTTTGKNKWTNDIEHAATIADGMAAEFSVEPIRYRGKKQFVLVQSHPLLGTKIFVRTAAAPEGPWSKPIAVYDVPDVKKSKNYFTYAGKGHLKISTDNQLLITYVVNSQDFWEMCGDASIYRPRAISLRLKTLFEKPK